MDDSTTSTDQSRYMSPTNRLIGAISTVVLLITGSWWLESTWSTIVYGALWFFVFWQYWTPGIADIWEQWWGIPRQWTLLIYRITLIAAPLLAWWMIATGRL